MKKNKEPLLGLLAFNEMMLLIAECIHGDHCFGERGF
jgi:hypothetical protein